MWSLASAATFRTTSRSIDMAQLRERREDLLHSRASKPHRELGAVPASLARHHDPLPELGMADPDADRIRSLPRSPPGAPRRAAARRRVDPRLLEGPLEAVRGNLLEEARRAASGRV